MIFALTGTDLDAKAALVERSVRRYTESVDGIDAVAFDRIGQGAARSRQPERRHRAAQDRRAGHRTGRRARVLVADGRAGAVQLPRVVRPRPSAARVGVRRRTGRHCSTRQCSTTPSTTTTARTRDRSHAGRHPTPRAGARRPTEPSPAAVGAGAMDRDELVVASLGEIVHARSGDKGGDANLGVWVRDRARLGLAPGRPSPSTSSDACFPKHASWRSRATNSPTWARSTSCIRGLLGTGATSTLRLDAQAKALGEWLRSRSTKVPQSLVKT